MAVVLPVVRPPAVRNHDDLYQRDARAAIKSLDTPGLKKNTVAGVLLQGGSVTPVPHGLGKIPTGWLIIDKTTQADVWRDASITQSTDTIALRSSGTVIVTLQFW